MISLDAKKLRQAFHGLTVACGLGTGVAWTIDSEFSSRKTEVDRPQELNELKDVPQTTSEVAHIFFGATMGTTAGLIMAAIHENSSKTKKS